MKISNTMQLKMRFALGLSLAIFFLSFFASCSSNKSMAIHQKKVHSRSASNFKEKKGKHEAEEENEKAFWSEERDRFEFDMLKDPTTGQIPRFAPQMAAEAAQRVRAEAKSAIDNRSAVNITAIPRGPNNLGGRTRAIGIDKRNANIILAGSVSSGVFRTTNGGASWTRVAPIGQIHNVTAIAQDTRVGHEDTWYYGGGEPIGNSASLGSSYRGVGIWKSLDNGLTWTPLAATQSVLELFDSPFDYVNRLVVDPSNGNVYAAAGNTIQQSTNGGSTWTNVLGTFTGTNYTDIIVTPTGKLYAGFDGRDAIAGVWTSTTGASGSWTKIGIPGTTPGWHAAGAYGRTVLAYAPSSPNIVFALYWNGISHTSANRVVEAKLFKWDQTATTWADLSANLPDEPGYSQGNDPFAVQTGYDLVVAVKPDDANTVFVGGTNVYRSTSGFTNTTATTRIGGYNSPANYALYPNHHPDIHVLNFATGDNNTLYCGDDGGIQKADITTPTVTWTSLNNDYITYQYYHADISPVNGSPVIMGGAQDNGTTSNPGGAAFSSILGGDGCQTGIISYNSGVDFNVIAATQNGNLVRLDAPSSGWSIRPSGTTGSIFVTYFQLDQDNTNLLYYADNVSIFRTRNGAGLTGSTTGSPATVWQKMTALGLTGNIRSMASSRNNAYGAAYTVSDPNRKLYVGTETGRVYRLNDPAFVASTTAATLITPPAATLGAVCSSIAINPFNDNEIMVTYSNYGVQSVFHTINANSSTPTWTAVEGPAAGPVALGSARSCIIVYIGTTPTYIVGNSTGLYATQVLNGVSTVWEQIGSNEINYAICSSMRLRPSDNRIVLGTHGNGMFELQMPPTVIPTVNAVTNKIVCKGSPTTAITFSGSVPGTTFSWTNNTPAIGLAASGTDVIPSFIPTRPTNDPLVATITVTPSVGILKGTPITFTITVGGEIVFGTPSVTNVSCNGGSNGSVVVSATGGTGVITYSISPSVGTQSPSGTFNGLTAQTYTFTATDANGCTGTTTAAVSQPTAIVFGTPSVTNATCNGGSNGSVGVSATGGTGTITYSISPSVGTQSPSGTFNGLTAQTYTFTATDSKGCTKTATVTVGQPTAVVITPTITNALCFGGSSGAIAISVSGGTGSISYTISPNANTKSVTSPYTGLTAGTYTFTATDGNGCVKTKTADVTQPTQIVITTPIITNASCIGNSDGKIVTSASGGTGVISLGINPGNGTQSPAGTFTGLTPISYMIIATDANNCEVTKIATVSAGVCNATVYSVSGAARTESNTIVNNLTVSAKVNTTVVAADDAVNGSFNITMAPSNDVQIRPAKNNNEDAASGVTTFDISKVSRHFLGIEPLESPYKLIAADVDKSGEIDAVDMLLMRRFILRVISDLPGGNFRFIDKSYNFINPTNPFAEDFPEVVNFSTLNTNSFANFVAIKLGDVNDSYNALSPRSARTLTFNTEDMPIVAGNEYTVNISANKLDVAAFQGTFSFNGATVKSIKGGNLNNLSNGNFGIFTNAVTTSWNGKAQDSVDVVAITFVANKSGKLSDLLTINSTLTQAMANDVAGNEMNINLKFNTNKVVGGEFMLYQNQPNPVASKTTIGFNLPNESQASLTILTVDGKVVKVFNGQYKAGYNSITVDKSELQTSGVFYYRLETADYRATKKMIIIE